ncbi:MAG: hypothetical protein QHH24_04165 [Candidatus Bathyarchaeota archaeon]|nr:hypothetical protein [Candidatus Bathyarchaeota archaeon]
MPSLKTHCAISKKRTGNDFAELHRWIDEPTRTLGVDHRIKRHHYNENDKNTIKQYWDSKRKGLGEKAVIEWLFHIALDNLYTAFKMSKKTFSYGQKAYNFMQFGLSKAGYIHCKFDRVDEDELDFRFEGDFEEDYY